MRIAVFSDIHGNLQALKSTLEQISDKDWKNYSKQHIIIGMSPELSYQLQAYFYIATPFT